MLQWVIRWCKKIIKAGIQWVGDQVLQQARPSHVAVVIGSFQIFAS